MRVRGLEKALRRIGHTKREAQFLISAHKRYAWWGLFWRAGVLMEDYEAVNSPRTMPTRQVVADALRRIGLPHRAVRKLLAAGWRAVNEAEQAEAERHETEEARQAEDADLARDLEKMVIRLKDRRQRA